ncbi:hypothetical protein C5748_06020 [Phyllobacterium phragmitis]|uniref:Uncharacterized protein n=1 Tax=Phyllobacterium phragmitis TaxID=2670329 RepID=A0A2S9IUF1_9HYPH|nr:hypothetical protein [Phyllobacterium phragmitis]PRD44163.1 hypothetical protein C5748_06020 [Phyllobacterium phragmitis]
MQRYRFDQKAILIPAIAELLNRGVGVDEIDIHLSRIGPVDLDLFQQCLGDMLGDVLASSEMLDHDNRMAA